MNLFIWSDRAETGHREKVSSLVFLLQNWVEMRGWKGKEHAIKQMPPKWPILCSSEKNYGQEEKEGGKTWNKSTTLFCIVSAAVLFLGNWLERTDFFSVQISFSLQVFIGNEKVFQIIEKSMPCRRFAELKISLVFSYFLRAEDNKCLLCTHTETVVMFFLRGTICNDRHLRDLLYFNVLCNFSWILSFFWLLYLPYVDDSKQQTSLSYLLLKHFSCMRFLPS